MPARARRSDPDTSHEAAASITEAELTVGQRCVLATLRVAGPLADHDLDRVYEEGRMAGSGAPPLSPSGLRTRRRELYDAGLVELAGEITTPSGRRAYTWRAVPMRDHQPTLPL